MGSKRKSISSSTGKTKKPKRDSATTDTAAGNGMSKEEKLDEISLQLKQERERALSILDSMLNTSASHDSSIVEASDTEQDTHDTNTRSDTADSDTSDTSDKEPNLSTQQNSAPAKSVTVNTDLKLLFSSITDDNKGFTFLEDKGAYSEDTTVHHPPSDHEEETAPSKSRAPKYFFFHSNQEALQNRLDENSFFRTKSWEELEEEWPERRSAMKESCRRRRREAVRSGRKRKQPPRTTA